MKTMQIWSSFGAETWRDQFTQSIAFAEDPGQENEVVNLYPKITLHTVDGFGGAVTDAVGEVYAMMRADQKAELLSQYFGKEGMDCRLVRVPIDSCDFSSAMYEADPDPEDENLDHFSFAHAEKVIVPFLRDAQKAAGEPLSLILSPWSAPAYMKTNGSRLHGGKLKREYYRRWGRYICRYVQEYIRAGFLVRGITLQNEPHAAQPWDSCEFTGEEERTFLEEGILPALEESGLADLEIYIWDHNKERLVERMGEVLTSKQSSRVTGAAFHWYSGDHFEALAAARRLYPDKKLILSESAVEMYKFQTSDEVALSLGVAHEIGGDLQNGASAILDWNILLNEQGGPNHQNNFCIAPFLYDRGQKVLRRHILANQFAHYSRYLVPGSVIIGASRYTDLLDVTAARRPDGRLAVVFVNRSKTTLPVYLRLEGEIASLVLLPQSVTSGLIGDI